MDFRIEDIGGGVRVTVSAAHTFGTDSFLLSSFAAPKTGDKVCDLGTGCGIVPLLWLRDGLGPKHVLAVDIQPQAIGQLTESIGLSGLDGRLTPLLADLRELKGTPYSGGFDVVTCNPPYNKANTGIISESRSDRIARHETLCTIDDCCEAAAGLLRFGGRFCCCHLPERLVDVLASMRGHKIEPKRLRFVQKDKNSSPWLVLIEGKRGAKPFLKIDPALLLYENGATSDEMRGIYSKFGEIIN